MKATLTFRFSLRTLLLLVAIREIKRIGTQEDTESTEEVAHIFLYVLRALCVSFMRDRKTAAIAVN